MSENNEPTSKICTGCSEDKLLEEYGKESKGKLGRASKCKACVKARDKAYYEKNSDSVRARTKEYRLADPEREKESQRKRYLRRQNG